MAMSPDEFLDWMKDYRDGIAGSGGETYPELAADDMIAQFVREFDTEDSPAEVPSGDRKKKPKTTRQ